jgi:hypothetical protein
MDGDLALLSTKAELSRAVPLASVQHWAYARSEAVARMAHYAKVAIDAGVADRQMANAEHLADVLAQLLRGVLDDLYLTPQQQATAPDIVRRHLERLAGMLLETPRELP